MDAVILAEAAKRGTLGSGRAECAFRGVGFVSAGPGLHRVGARLAAD